MVDRAAPTAEAALANDDEIYFEEILAAIVLLVILVAQLVRCLHTRWQRWQQSPAPMRRGHPSRRESASFAHAPLSAAAGSEALAFSSPPVPARRDDNITPVPDQAKLLAALERLPRARTQLRQRKHAEQRTTAAREVASEEAFGSTRRGLWK